MPVIEYLVRSKMVNVLFTLVSVLTFHLCVSQPVDETLARSVKEGIHLTLLQRYDDALTHFREVTKRYPNHPYGYLYQVGVLQARAMDLETLIDGQVFDSLLTCAKGCAQEYSQPWRSYFLGLIDGYRAYYHAERSEWISALRYGSSSAAYFEDVLKVDSSVYDAYVGIGTYYFWKSEKTSFLTWLPFLSDDRESGIRLLTLAAENAEYSKYSAISSLISIYLERKQYTEAIRWAKKALQSYPRNRIFLWGIATAYDRSGQHSEAVHWYTVLLSEILASQQAHPYNEIVCRLNLSKAKLALNDTLGVSTHLKQILQYRTFSFPERFQTRARKKFDEAEVLLKKLNG